MARGKIKNTKSKDRSDLHEIRGALYLEKTRTLKAGKSKLANLYISTSKHFRRFSKKKNIILSPPGNYLSFCYRVVFLADSLTGIVCRAIANVSIKSNTGASFLMNGVY